MGKQLAKIKKKEALEEGRKAGLEEANRHIIKILLKNSDFSLEKIASLAGVSLETVKKMNVISIIEELAEVKRKEILKECRASDYSEYYSARYVRDYVESYKVGLQDGVQLVNRRFVEGLLKKSGYTLEEMASLPDLPLETVKKIKGELHRA